MKVVITVGDVHDSNIDGKTLSGDAWDRVMDSLSWLGDDIDVEEF